MRSPVLRFVAGVTSLLLSYSIASGAENSAAVRGAAKAGIMKIRIKLEEKTLIATLADNATSRDFVSLLPLTRTLKTTQRLRR